jgi:hypothetical protein
LSGQNERSFIAIAVCVPFIYLRFSALSEERFRGEGRRQSEKGDYRGLEGFGRGFRQNGSGLDSRGVMQLVLMTQYFGTLKESAANDHTNAILVPHTPNTLIDIFSQIRNAIVAGTELTTHPTLASGSSTDQHALAESVQEEATFSETGLRIPRQGAFATTRRCDGPKATARMLSPSGAARFSHQLG